MTTNDERNWTAQIVIAFKDPLLNQRGRMLEDEMRKVMARVDDPRQVADYLLWLVNCTLRWTPPTDQAEENK